ncbi:hypothetical protein ACA910_012582 [Epithemia clementina (nom. ined.)]
MSFPPRPPTSYRSQRSRRLFVAGGPRGQPSARGNPRANSNDNNSIFSDDQDVSFLTNSSTGDCLATLSRPTNTGRPMRGTGNMTLHLSKPIEPKIKSKKLTQLQLSQVANQEHNNQNQRQQHTREREQRFNDREGVRPENHTAHYRSNSYHERSVEGTRHTTQAIDDSDKATAFAKSVLGRSEQGRSSFDSPPSYTTTETVNMNSPSAHIPKKRRLTEHGRYSTQSSDDRDNSGTKVRPRDVVDLVDDGEADDHCDVPPAAPASPARKPGHASACCSTNTTAGGASSSTTSQQTVVEQSNADTDDSVAANAQSLSSSQLTLSQADASTEPNNEALSLKTVASSAKTPSSSSKSNASPPQTWSASFRRRQSASYSENSCQTFPDDEDNKTPDEFRWGNTSRSDNSHGPPPENSEGRLEPQQDKNEECMIVEGPNTTGNTDNYAVDDNGSNILNSRRQLRRKLRETGEETKRLVDQCSEEVFQPSTGTVGKLDHSAGPSASEIIDLESSSNQKANGFGPMTSGYFSLSKQNDPGRQRQPRRATDTANQKSFFPKSPIDTVVKTIKGLFGINNHKNTRPSRAKAIHPGDSLKKAENQVDSRKRPRIVNSVAPISRREKPALARRKSERLQVKPEIVEIDDDTDDECGDEAERLIKYDAVRISIGELVVHVDCKIVFHMHGNLTLEFRHSKRKTRRSTNSGAGDIQEIDFDLEHFVNELFFFRCGEQSNDEDFEDFSFLALRTTGKLTDKLKSYSRSYDPDSQSVEPRFVVVEFREDADLDALLSDLQMCEERLSLKPREVPQGMVREYCRVLLTDSEAEADRRKSFQPKTSSSQRIRSAVDGDIVVVYPFGGDEEEIENAAKNLNELKDGGKTKRNDRTPGDEGQKPLPTRDHFLTVQTSDFLRLEPEQYLNDTLIDFWMKWISRGDTSNTHFFTTHFYTTLAKKGVAGVKNWTQKKGIDVFTKKFVFFPINKNFHWSLAVAVNPGHIQYGEPDEDNKPHACLLFFDSLKAHSKFQVAKKILAWLNAEWKRINGVEDEPFTSKSMAVYAPKVPYQENGWDCGVYVCRYAYALYNLRHRTFSVEECQVGLTKVPPFSTLITENEKFQFNADDIDRIRSEFIDLILKLSAVYKCWKKKADRAELEEKRRLKDSAVGSEHGEKGVGASSPSKLQDPGSALKDDHQQKEMTIKELCNVERKGSGKENIVVAMKPEMPQSGSERLCSQFSSIAIISKEENSNVCHLNQRKPVLAESAFHGGVPKENAGASAGAVPNIDNPLNGLEVACNGRDATSDAKEKSFYGDDSGGVEATVDFDQEGVCAAALTDRLLNLDVEMDTKSDQSKGRTAHVRESSDETGTMRVRVAHVVDHNPIVHEVEGTSNVGTRVRPCQVDLTLDTNDLEFEEVSAEPEHRGDDMSTAVVDEDEGGNFRNTKNRARSDKFSPGRRGSSDPTVHDVEQSQGSILKFIKPSQVCLPTADENSFYC